MERNAERPPGEASSLGHGISSDSTHHNHGTDLFNRKMVLSTCFKPASASAGAGTLGLALGEASAISSTMAFASGAPGFEVSSDDMLVGY